MTNEITMTNAINECLVSRSTTKLYDPAVTDHGDRRDQRLEPDGDQLSRLARRLPTAAVQPPPGKAGPQMRTVIAIGLGAALGAGGFALAQHEKHGDAAKVKSLLVQDISERIDGKEARVSVLEVSYGPGGFTPPHRHPGAVFGHVLEGELEAQLEGQPLRKLKAGDTFYEPTMALHSVSRNPSKTANTRLLAVILHPRDAKELVILEKPKH